MLSQTAEYALRAVVAIAQQPAGEAIGAARLAAQLEVPPNYLGKTLHQLARAGVLDSTRGKLGGFRLARPAGKISLLEVVAPFDEGAGYRSCLLGRKVCSDLAPCAAHARWRAVSERTVQFFRETTVADLV
jgi:Rrf2 family protein